MKGLVEHLFKSLVSKPEKVKINQRSQNGAINFSVQVDEKDMGLVIGRQGKTIKALRNLIKTRALIEKQKVQLTLEETKK